MARDTEADKLEEIGRCQEMLARRSGDAGRGRQVYERVSAIVIDAGAR